MKRLEIPKNIYDNYYNLSYILSLLCNKDVLTKLDKNYSSGFILEEDLLTELNFFLKENGEAFLNDERIRANFKKIIENSSSNNDINSIKDDIKKSFNSIDSLSNDSYPFLRTQYIFRKYGVNSMANIILFKKYINEARNLFNQFLINSKEQLYNSIAFDFKLISALPKLENNPGLIYDECLSNYQLFASIYYIKAEYPYMFKDQMFLNFIKLITEFQDLERKEINSESCLFDDFYSENEKILNYINKRLKRL